jgi:hypothetical protein
MVKKIMIIILLLAFQVNLKSQNWDFYNRDSLLISIDGLIRDDFLKDSIYVLERSWIGFGESFILEIVFDNKNTCIISTFRISESMKKKFEKKSLRLPSFIKYVNKYHTLPYNTFEYFNYRFLLLAKKGELFGDAIYGEYKFKATEKKISIMDKKIEVLQGEDAIIQKYKSNF